MRRITSPVIACARFAVIFILFLNMIPMAFARYPTQGYDFSVTNVSLSSTSLVKGTTLTVTVTIKNVGTLLGSVKVYLGIKQPDGSNIYPSNGYVYDIAVSSSKNIALTWNIPTSAQTGTHYVDIDVYNTPETWLFDSTGFVYSFQVSPVQHDPVATCNSPANSNIQLTKGASQTFTAYVTDQDGDLNYVEYYLGGVCQGRGTSRAREVSSRGSFHSCYIDHK